MLEIIRHPDLYRNPVGFTRDFMGEEWQKAGGKKPVLIFPTQSLLEFWEEQLLSVFGSWGGVRFVLFDGLVRDILQETRPDLSELTPGCSVLLLRLVVNELVQQKKIPFLAQTFPSVGFYATLRQEILLLKRAGLDPTSFKNFVQETNQSIQELALVYERYQQLLSDLHLADDEEKLRLAIAESTNATGWLKWKQILVIGFTDFTQQQEALLNNLSALVKVTVIFDHEIADRKGLPLPTLRSGERKEELVYPRPGDGGETWRTLEYLQHNLWASPPLLTAEGPDGSVELLKVKGGSRHELAAVAAELKKLLSADPTLSPEQIAVISPYPLDEVYQILSLFTLPLTVQIRSPLANEPAAKALLQPFRVLLSTFEWAEMIKYLRWGGICLEEQLCRVEPPTTLREWEEVLAKLYATEEERGAKSKELLAFLAQIPTQGTYGQFFQLCLDWLDQPLLLNIFLPKANTAAPYLQARFLQTSILGKLRALIKKSLNLVSSFGDKEVALPDFYITLESILAREVSNKPTSWANGIRILTPTEARGLSFRVTCVVGLNEGLVPHLTPTSWLLREETIQSWPSANLFPTNLEQLLRERLLFFYVLKTAREKLILTCCQTNDEGEQLNPSSFWDDLKKLLPTGQQIKEVETGNLLNPHWTNQTLDLKKEIEEKIQAELARRRGSLPLSGRLGPKEVRLIRSKLAKAPLSISALEVYGTCPFSYFCRWWLQIDPFGEPEFLPSRLAEGSIAHFVLKEFFRHHRRTVLQRKDLNTYITEIRALVEQYYPQSDASKSTLQHNLLVLGRENLISVLTRVLKEEITWEEKTDGRFTPRYLELGFGGISQEADENSTPQPLVLEVENPPPDQPPLRLWGKIDRIDTDGTENFIVYDYKSGTVPAKAEIINGKRLQLPLYLLAVSRLILPEGTPMGAAYYSLRQTSRLRGIWRQEALEFGVKSRSTLPDEEWEEMLATAVTVALQSYDGILRGDFPFCPPENCPSYCTFRPICRHRSWRRGEKDETEYGTRTGR